MADRIQLSTNSGTGAVLSTDEVTKDTVAQHVQFVKLMNGASDATDQIGGDATNGLDVDVTRMAALVANSGVDIGDVTVNNVAGAPVPVQQSDGSAAQTFAAPDLDSGAGTVNRIAVGLVVPASGGPATVTGDATNGLDVDVTRLPALVAGTANIGDVDVLTVPADPFGANADAASATGSISAKLRFIAATGIPVTGTVAVGGDTAHDATDAGNPVKVGGVAVAGGASPTPVASGERTRWIFNAHGIPYVIAGHPNLITREYDFGTAAQTDLNLAAAAVAADERVYVTRFEAMADNDNTDDVSVRAGFGAASVPAASATGVSGMIASHPGIAAGSGIVVGNGSGIIAVGALGEEPRLTSAAASTNLRVVISYYLVDETP